MVAKAFYKEECIYFTCAEKYSKHKKQQLCILNRLDVYQHQRCSYVPGVCGYGSLGESTKKVRDSNHKYGFSNGTLFADPLSLRCLPWSGDRKAKVIMFITLL